MDEAGALRLAFSLAMLTFYTGVLIYALPIPYRGLKAWAPRLIADSILAAGLIAVYYALTMLPGFIRGLIGVTWEAYDARTYMGFAVSATLKLLIYLAKLAAKATEGIVGYTITAYSWVLERLSDLALLAAITLKALGWVAANTYKFFIALGLVLYSIPFRLGRAAGAWLIALGIVLPAALPALPVFEAHFLGSAGGGMAGVVATHMLVTDKMGDPVDYGVLYLMSGSAMNGTTYSKYPLLNGEPLGTLGARVATYPAGARVYAYLELDGVGFALYPRPLSYDAFKVINGTPYYVLEAPALLYANGLLIVYIEDWAVMVNVTDTGSVVSLSIVTIGGMPGEVRWPKDCDVEVYVEEVSGAPVSVGDTEWYWLGVEGRGLRIEPGGPAHYRLYIYYDDCGVEPRLNLAGGRDYFVDVLKGSIDVVSIAYYMLLAQLFLPTLYLAIVAMLVYGVARLLGGRDRGVPRVF